MKGKTKHKLFPVNYENLIAITALHYKKLRKLKSSFIKYRTAIHYYLKDNNFNYSCSVISKLSSKLWRKESTSIKLVYKRLNEATKKCDSNERHNSLVNQKSSNYTANFKVSFKQQKLAPLTNCVIFSEGLLNFYSKLLFDYKRIQKLEKEFSDTLEKVNHYLYDKELFRFEMGKPKSKRDIQKSKNEQDVKNYKIFYGNSPNLFPLKKEGLISYTVNLVNKNLKPSTYRQYIRHIKNHHIDTEGSWNYKEFDPVINNGLNKLNAKSLSNNSTLNSQSSSPTQPAQSFTFQHNQGPLNHTMQIPLDENTFLQNIVPSQLGQTTLQEFYSPLDQLQYLSGSNPAAYTISSQLDQDNNILLTSMQLEQPTNHVQEVRNLLNKEVQELIERLNQVQNSLSQEVREFIINTLNQKVQELDLSLNEVLQDFKTRLNDIIQNI
ncbi:19889_t:CDS:2 [Gigaspora margarita]|uniref:19889_t:CDS:1 n=1 Tax=Gigaspora margarita TaxID=4874 RepID=A0ABN7VVC4_GIGMA|nr:19889_t:CDS:2 [Gigaspora margarita]